VVEAGWWCRVEVSKISVTNNVCMIWISVGCLGEYKGVCVMVTCTFCG
jgi:hypothetical protein